MFMIDTHVHTCLSPCAELDMHPAALVGAAVQAGLDAVAICDHNSAENVAAVERAGKREGVAIIPGMEITSSEEVHIVGLLPDLEAALALQSRVYRFLPGRNVEAVFGMQVIANEHAEVLGFNEHLLSGATALGVDEVVGAIHDVDGIAVAAHVDREGFGIIGQLGMIPQGLPLDALEISRRTPLPEARAAYAPRGEYPLLCGSDAHEPRFVGQVATFLLLEEPSFTELRRAIAGRDGRAVLGGGRLMEDVALHILDIAQNSIEAGATAISITVNEDVAADTLGVEICDNGPGMDPATLASAADPFFTTRTTRRVGMGLPLLAQAARAAGGEMAISSAKAEGCTVRATFQYSHIDRAPLGDIETTMMVLFAGHPDLDVTFRHRAGNREYTVKSSDLEAAGLCVGSPAALGFWRKSLRQGEQGLKLTA